MVDQGSWS